MKKFTIIFTVISVVLIVFNATKLSFRTPFEGVSIVALITIFALLCDIILLHILRISKRFGQILKNKK
jgi:hypothetical protein